MGLALVVMPLAEVSIRLDRFQCVPYRCVITAGSCADRQMKAQEMGAHDVRVSGFAHCFKCADGGVIAAALADTRVVKHCAFDGCDRGVTDAGNRLCEPHRRANRAPKHTSPSPPLVIDPTPEPKEPAPMAKTDEQIEKRRAYMKEYNARKAAGKTPRAKRAAVATTPHSAPLVAEQLVEALQLVDVIGWETARSLAARIQAGR